MESNEQINLKSRTPYQGKNQDVLSEVSAEKNYKSNMWGTYQQWKTLGKKVSIGQKGTVVFHPTTYPTGKFDRDGKEVLRNSRKYWYVFNEEQTEQLNSEKGKNVL